MRALENSSEGDLSVRLSDVAGQGIILTTDYSGSGQAEFSFGSISQALSSRGAAPKMTAFRCGDVQPFCRRVLLAHEGGMQPQCVFGDMMVRMPGTMKAQFENLQQKYNDMMARRVEIGSASFDDVGRQFAQECKSIYARDREGTSACDLKAFCYKCRRMCPVFPDRTAYAPGSLIGSMAGPNCTPWSAMGSKRGWLSAASMPFFEYAREILMFDYDFVIIECTRTFDLTLCEMLFGDIYDIKDATFSAEELGFAQLRWRKYTVMLRRTSLRWNFEFNKDNFLKIFGRKRQLTASSHFRAPPEEVAQEIHRLAAARFLPDQAPNGQPWPFISVLAPTHKRILDNYMDMAQDKGIDVHTRDITFDLQQHAHFNKVRNQTSLRALLRRSIVWSTLIGRTLIPKEHLEVQGIPVFASVAQAPFHRLLKKQLPPAKLRALAGNAMHSGVAGAVLMFALSCSHPTPAAARDHDGL